MPSAIRRKLIRILLLAALALSGLTACDGPTNYYAPPKKAAGSTWAG